MISIVTNNGFEWVLAFWLFPFIILLVALMMAKLFFITYEYFETSGNKKNYTGE